APKRHCHGRDRLRERRADWNRLRRHGGGDSLVAVGKMAEEHQHALTLRVLGLMGEGKDNALLFPSGDAIRVAVGQNGNGLFEVHDDWFDRPRIGGWTYE